MDQKYRVRSQSCVNRVWAMLDGYQLLSFSGDATLISDVQCSASGGVRVEGYLFGINDFEPTLHAGPVAAHRFALTLDVAGRIIDSSLKPEGFNILEYCATSAPERTGLCESARSALDR